MMPVFLSIFTSLVMAFFPSPSDIGKCDEGPASSSASLSEETYEAHLSVRSYDMDRKVFMREEAFTLKGEYTTDTNAVPSGMRLEAYLQEELASDGIGFISVKVTTLGNGQGTLSLTFQALPDGVQSRLVSLETGDGTHTILQTRPQRLTFVTTPFGQNYPGDTWDLSVEGGTDGLEYHLVQDGTILPGTRTACDGGAMAFNGLGPGHYCLHSDALGQTTNGIELGWYDIFCPDGLYVVDYPPTLNMQADAEGGTYAVSLVSKDLDAGLYGKIADRMNTEGVPDRWNPSLGMEIGLSVQGKDTLKITFRCAPNYSTATKTNDTGMYVDDSGGLTLKVIQACNSSGSPLQYALTGEWTDRETGTFALTLSGSQYGVIYTLLKDGEAVASHRGTGTAMEFAGFSGWKDFGTYRVIAEHDGKTSAGNEIKMELGDLPHGDNYVAMRSYGNADGTAAVTDVTYFDGLGCPIQTIQQGASGSGKNIVRPIVRDAMRHLNATACLPYVSENGNVAFISDAPQMQASYWAGTDTRPYSNTSYESGKHGRAIAFMREGETYLRNDRKVTMSRSVAHAADSILKLSYIYPSEGRADSLSVDGFWEDGRLLVTRTVDEDGDTSQVYTDAAGRTVMTRAIDNGLKHDTYYLRDLRDSIVCIVQPAGTRAIEEAIRTGYVQNSYGFDEALTYLYCYTFRYDAWGNVTEAHAPSGGMVITIYDGRNRPVYMSGSVQRNAGRWRYFVYDSLDRVTEEGFCTLSRSGTKAAKRRKSRKNADNGTDSPAMGVGRDLAGLSAGQVTAEDRIVFRRVEYWTENTPTSMFVTADGTVSTEKLRTDRCLGLPYRETLYTLDGNGPTSPADTVTRYFFYDGLGRLLERRDIHAEGDEDLYAFGHDFRGNITSVLEEHAADGPAIRLQTIYSYDSRNRVTSMRRLLSGEELSPVTYAYDDLGRLFMTTIGETGQETVSYNLQGWPIRIDATLRGESTFSQSLGYHDRTDFEGIGPSFTGRVTSVSTSRRGGETYFTEGFGYDHMGRLVEHRSENPKTGRRDGNTEKCVEFDPNGNIVRLQRELEDENRNFGMTYTGNRVFLAYDMKKPHVHYYDYDLDGRLTVDIERTDTSYTDLRLEYDLMGNLSEIRTDGMQTARYSYLPDGTKLGIVGPDGSGLQYRGNLVYQVKADGTRIPESMGYDGGRIVFVTAENGSTTMRDCRMVRDRLGSVRAVVDVTREGFAFGAANAGIILETDYTPFGTACRADTTYRTLASFRYGFNGKESQSFTGLPFLDYGARLYNTHTAQWIAPDPMSALDPSFGQYVFCANDPVNHVDPNGLFWLYDIETGNLLEHIDDPDDDFIYLISKTEYLNPANREENFRTFRNDGNNMLGRMLSEKSGLLSDEILSAIFTDLFNRANKTEDGGTTKKTQERYSIVIKDSETMGFTKAETRKKSRTITINKDEPWFRGYDVMLILAHEIGHIIDCSLQSGQYETDPKTFEIFADSVATVHWAYKKASNFAKERLLQHISQSTR